MSILPSEDARESLLQGALDALGVICELALLDDGVELSSDGYARAPVLVSNLSISDGVLTNDTQITFTVATGEWEYDQAVLLPDGFTGSPDWWPSVKVSGSVSSGETLAIPAGDLTADIVAADTPTPIDDGQYLDGIKVADVKTYTLDGQTFIVVDNRISTDKIFSADIDPTENLKIEAFLDPGLRISIDTNFDPHIEP